MTIWSGFRPSARVGWGGGGGEERSVRVHTFPRSTSVAREHGDDFRVNARGPESEGRHTPEQDARAGEADFVGRGEEGGKERCLLCQWDHPHGL